MEAGQAETVSQAIGASQPALPKGQSGAMGGAPSLLRGYVFGHGAAGLAGVAGYLFGGVHGALEAFGGYEVAKRLWMR